MEYLERKKDVYKDATQKEPKAKRDLMDAFMAICELAQMIEKEVKDDETFKIVFDKCVGKKTAMKKAFNALPESLAKAKKSLDEVAKARKEAATATASGKKQSGGSAAEMNMIVGNPGKPMVRPRSTSSSEDPTVSNRSKKKKATITPAMREHAWKKYIGNYAESLCPVCVDNKIKMTAFTAGHIVAEACGGTTDKDNLMPICNTCNVRMATKNLFEYCRKEFGRDPVFPTGIK